MDVSGEYKLKSSLARIGLEHLNAGWCDPGWHGSALTLELKNMTRKTCIIIKPGDRIGQMIFWRSQPVRLGDSYYYRGRYNNDAKVHGAKQSLDAVSNGKGKISLPNFMGTAGDQSKK
jgi:deoxycytidine triphosphate deaminase